MKFPQIFADKSGETHFGDHETPDKDLAMGPPPNPVGKTSNFGAVRSMNIFAAPAGTEAPAHNAAQPYIVIMLSGIGEVRTSDGETRRFQPGDVLFCNDLTGKGHVTRAVTDMKLAFINRSQD
jgi:quercetin dioxygenase-like cupin family protein